jgi:hypothetical protein
MPQAPNAAVMNNFTGGLKTEFTGLNFPENSCTDVDNCVFSLIGSVYRRSGFDYEENYQYNAIQSGDLATSFYKWNNVGGDGETQILVSQVGQGLNFYLSSSATDTDPLSTTHLPLAFVSLDFELVSGSTFDPATAECEYADGNGYLFIFNKYCEPFYCTYDPVAQTVTQNQISVQIRDFAGIPEPGVIVNNRPSVLTNEHEYNLENQGWTAGAAWSVTSSSSNTTGVGSKSWTVPSGVANISNGQNVDIYTAIGVVQSLVMTGTVTSYSGTTLTINVGSAIISGVTSNDWTITESNAGFISTWFSDEGNYPSNADVWWQFKDTSNNFDPSTTAPNVTLNSGQAAQGHYILSAFNQQRSAISGIPGLTDITTTIRPKTGTWFQGRVWYTGVDAQFLTSGDAPYSTWSESIYFSQIVTSTSQFGYCYQVNDPTAEDFFDLLPTDGGVINIQGCGSIYKLFPVQNGLLVFAANGIWFITGSQGIGFSANDYTITKISNVQSISSFSYINVLGWPIFWNEEGIYTVSPSSQGGGLTVENIALGTILTYYSEIPLQSKKYARGDYNPLTFVVQWCFRDTNETGLSDRYNYNKVLNWNTSNKAFYPYTFVGTTDYIKHALYIVGPGGSNSPDPVFKYPVTIPVPNVVGEAVLTFGEERDDVNWVDWISDTTSYQGTGIGFTSYFFTGYNLAGKALTKWSPTYVYVYSDNTAFTQYKIKGRWDFASSGNAGKDSNYQVITNDKPNYQYVYRRHKIRGRGMALQLNVQSISGQPFNIIGWTIWEMINQGVG